MTEWLHPLPGQPAGVAWPEPDPDGWPTGSVPPSVEGLVDELFGDPDRFGDTYAVVVVVGGRLLLERYGGALPSFEHEPTRAGSLPDQLFTPFMWFMATRVLTVKTPLGRKVRDHFLDPPHGIPLGRARRKDFAAAGIERVPRMTGARNGQPVLEDGRGLTVSNVIWCTGFKPAYDWIDLSFPLHNGFPIHYRGIVEPCPGLYFVGLPFLYSLSSALLGGVGRDAKHIVDHIES